VATVAKAATVAADAVEVEAEGRRKAEVKEEHRKLVKKRIGVCRQGSAFSALQQVQFKTDFVTNVTTFIPTLAHF